MPARSTDLKKNLAISMSKPYLSFPTLAENQSPAFFPLREYSIFTSEEIIKQTSVEPGHSHVFHIRKKTRLYFKTLSLATALVDPNFHKCLEILPDSDMDSKELLQSSLCEERSERSKRSPQCKWENCQLFGI